LNKICHKAKTGTTDVDYAASIAQHTAAAPTGTLGAFRNGAITGVSYSDFDQSYNPINSYEQGSGGGGYVVRKGDTLQGIAAGLYGDSSLWYKIAEVNGLSGQTALIEGQSLILPAGVIRNTNNASTFQPYDPASTIGDTSPTAAAAPPKKKGCGAGGQILLAIIAVAVALVVAPYALGAAATAGAPATGLTAFFGGAAAPKA
jgi:LysM repeat protein